MSKIRNDYNLGNALKRHFFISTRLTRNNDDTKLFYLKADRSKEEREEYKRLRDVKKGLLEEGKTAEIKYGKLYVDDTCVDQINTKVNDFLC